MKKTRATSDRYRLVEKALFDSGARCIREEKSSDKRFTLEFFINNGRLVILQHFTELDGIEVFRPINEKNDLQATIADTLEWFGVSEEKKEAA
ncbi:MAG: hypothetical protein WAL34_04150 [Acidobacteriaceae bacterium]